MDELSIGSLVAILAQGDTHWVQVFSSSLSLSLWLFVAI